MRVGHLAGEQLRRAALGGDVRARLRAQVARLRIATGRAVWANNPHIVCVAMDSAALVGSGVSADVAGLLLAPVARTGGHSLPTRGNTRTSRIARSFDSSRGAEASLLLAILTSVSIGASRRLLKPLHAGCAPWEHLGVSRRAHHVAPQTVRSCGAPHAPDQRRKHLAERRSRGWSRTRRRGQWARAGTRHR